jgi:hypothetical protein
MPNKIKEPVKPTMQDSIIEGMYRVADASVYQTPYRDKQGKKKAFLNKLNEIVDNVDNANREAKELREERPAYAERREAPLRNNESLTSSGPRAAPNTVAIDLAQTLYEQEMKKLLQQIAEASIAEQRAYQSQFQTPIYENIFDQTLRKMLEDVAIEELNLHNKRLKMVQSNEIKKMAKDQIVDNLALDHMLGTVAQHGRVVAEDDDAGKLLDSEFTSFFFQVLTL